MIRKILNSLPYGEKLWLILRIVKNILILPPKPAPFFGWDMYTPHATPWSGDTDIVNAFNKTYGTLLKLVGDRKFKISMFHEEYESHEYMLNGLKWRHYNVYWSIIYVLKNVELSTHNFVECGVADGVTSYFALNATLANIKNATSAKFYLYDAWDAMQKQHLSSTEKTLSGEYDFLEVDNTRNNLLEYEDMTIFNKGYIPEIFETVENPKKISWMHIDLNSSMPTLAALNYFYKKLDQGGIIIFDDYGWNAHLDTKLVVDNFFNAKKGILLPLPTGQAVYFSSAI